MPPPKTSDWVRGPTSPNHGKHSMPPVLISDKLYEGKPTEVTMPVRPEPAHIDSAALAFELEAETVNRKLEGDNFHSMKRATSDRKSPVPAATRAETGDGTSPALPTEAALHMFERGLISPVTTHAAWAQKRRDSEMTVVAGSPAKDRGGASQAESTGNPASITPKEVSKVKQQTVVDGGDPLEVLVVDDDPCVAPRRPQTQG